MTWAPFEGYGKSPDQRDEEASRSQFGWDTPAEDDGSTDKPAQGSAGPSVPVRDEVSQDGMILLDDDDSRWRTPAPPPGGLTGAVASGEDPVSRANAWLEDVRRSSQPAGLLQAIAAGSCNALSGGIRCILCEPKDRIPKGIKGYYRASTGRVVLCADRINSKEELAATLGHELIHAYDFCRKGMRIPGVRTQVPYALECATEACSEVRAYAMGTFADAPFWADKRNLVYRSALASMLSNPMSECRKQPGDPRMACQGVLDAIFDTCLADAAPFNAAGREAQQRGKFPPATA